MTTRGAEGGVGAVQKLDLNVPERLSNAARSLVWNKYLMDKAVATNGGAMLARDLHDGAYGPHEPVPFLYKIIPFMRTGDRTDKSILALVPTSHTVGCSWKWRGSQLEANEVNRRRCELTDEVALLNGHLNRTEYTWIKPLGIIAPGEGKNRVDFLREEGVDAIPAKVNERTYPSPERIKIYRVKCSGFYETWAILDDRWVQKVCNPSWTIPLMDAYGVSVSEIWPRSFPPPRHVVLALFESPGITSPLGHPEFEPNPIVDLDTIHATMKYQDEEISCAMFQLKHVKIGYHYWMIAAAGTVLSIVALGLSPHEWVSAQVIAGMVFGASTVGACIPFLTRVLAIKREHVKHQLPLPRHLAPKYRESVGNRKLG